MKEMYGMIDSYGELKPASVATGQKWVWSRRRDAEKQSRARGYHAVKVYLVPETSVIEHAKEAEEEQEAAIAVPITHNAAAFYASYKKKMLKKNK